MESRVIEMAIGLVFVFLLASLMVTTIQEALSSWRDWRAKNLREAIFSMMGDQEDMRNKLFEHPLLVSLFPTGKSGPSYIPADVFSTVLLDTLFKAGKAGGVPEPRSASPVEFVNSLKKVVGQDSQFDFVLQNLESLARGVESDWVAFEQRIEAWFNHTAERSIGWFKRNALLWSFIIGLGVAAVCNINTLAIAQALWTDPVIRKQVADAATQFEATYVGGKSGLPVSSLPASTTQQAVVQWGDPLLILLNTYKENLAKAGSQYKEKGGGKPSPVPAKLADLHTQVVFAGTALELERKARAARISPPAGVLEADDPVLKLLPTPDKDPDISGLDTHMLALLQDAHKKLRLAIAAERQAYTLDAPSSKLDCTLPEAKSEPACALKLTCDRLEGGDKEACMATCRTIGTVCEAKYVFERTVGRSGLPIGWPAETRTKVWGDLAGGPAGFISTFLILVAGWALTALATTLGAPFWFDLLGKLVKIRAAGSRPEGEAKADAASQPTVNAPAALPDTAAQPDAFSDAITPAEKILSANEIIDLQIHLQLFNAKVSGRLDTATRQAIAAWQRNNSRVVTGQLTTEEVALIRGEALAPAPAATSTTPLAPSGEPYRG